MAASVHTDQRIQCIQLNSNAARPHQLAQAEERSALETIRTTIRSSVKRIWRGTRQKARQRAQLENCAGCVYTAIHSEWQASRCIGGKEESHFS